MSYANIKHERKIGKTNLEFNPDLVIPGYSLRQSQMDNVRPFI
eukprot:CAMPEP_0170546874 /NCGR_PEP_ID=MMETSP0211-20121228/5226_1 /TAXON_ID=311385 /ORGANISM="Pseudokeronopsis sp., Strain OXSARD2" /LENGTH=42 /DNA_ID= /DNA_START= /DNA_END= /DNA_ORIENTATION=